MTSHTKPEAMPPINIVGAGIGGLVLGRSLLKRGIPSILYDRANSKPRHTYAITLHEKTYKSLLPILDLDEATFASRLAVDGSVGGHGAVSAESIVHRGKMEGQSMRVNRSKFEVLLREGLDIRWESNVQKIAVNANSSGRDSSDAHTLALEDGTTIQSPLTIATDGVHSTIRRSLLPKHEAKVLPFVAFNGKRRIPTAKWKADFASSSQNTNVVEKRIDSSVFSISVADVEPERVSITWIYSRPSQGDADKLYKPNRAQADARDIPSEFYDEIKSLQGGLEGPFKEIFAVENMETKGLLHWLMRTVPVPDLDELTQSAQQGVVFLGDSVHAESIIGGEGANNVIADAIGLADVLSGKSSAPLGTRAAEWTAKQHATWTEGIERNEKHIAEMHT